MNDKKVDPLGPPGVPGFDPDPPARRGFPYVVNPLRHETIFSDVKLGNFLRFSSGGPLLSPLQEALTLHASCDEVPAGQVRAAGGMNDRIVLLCSPPGVDG